MKINQIDNFGKLKVKTESNNFGVLKTIIVLLLIAIQGGVLAFTYLYILVLFKWYFALSILLTIVACVNVLSSDYYGQAKATWILFLLVSLGFGYFIYLMSDKRFLFAKARKKYNRIFQNIVGLQMKNKLNDCASVETKANCNYLYNVGNFVSHCDSKIKYFQSGNEFFDEIINEISAATEFVFMEFYTISNGILLDKIFEILKKKVEDGVDVRVIYDDMGSHGTLKRKTKKEILASGIKLIEFNRLVPIFNIALNLRDHRKIVIVDGKVSFTGGANLSDEYINEKQIHGYWKDCGIKIIGRATDNLTISFLVQWQFLTSENIDYKLYIAKSQIFNGGGIIVPFVSGPNYKYSISRDVYINLISNADKKLYIMTPYFIPDETIVNLIINKVRSGVDVRIILPDIADKKFVYIVSRNNAEKLIDCGVKLFTMTNGFVHAKVVMNEKECVVGSINMDLRSFYQQFESAVYTNDEKVLKDVNIDFDNTINLSREICCADKKRNKLTYRVLAGVLNLISPFM